MDFLNILLIWTALTLGFEEKDIIPIRVVEVSEVVIQTVLCPETMKCHSPAVWTGERLLVLKDVDFKKDLIAAGFVVHHMAHHVQLTTKEKGDFEAFKAKAEEYEAEAKGVQDTWTAFIWNQLDSI